MNKSKHIPHLKTIGEFYDQMRIGTPQGNDFAIMRIEDQPDTKRLEMPLFRCQFFRIVLIKSKGVEWLLPDKQFKSTENCIYFSHPGKLESWLTTKNIHGYLVCFTEAFAQTTPALSSVYPFFTFEHSNLLHLKPSDVKWLGSQQEEMLKEMGNAHADHQEMLSALLKRYMISIKRLFLQQNSTVPEKSRNNHLVFQKFRKELDLYFAELAADQLNTQPNVSTIADRIFLHPSYLNTVVKSVSGKTASKWIQEKAVLEAKSYLMHTNLSITEIAFQLGFTNVSYFNRLFKKWTSLTPSAFKSKLD